MSRTIPMLIVLVFASTTARAGDELSVVGTWPMARSISGAPAAPVVVTFDRPVDLDSVNADSFRVFGRWSGTHFGTFAISGDGTRVALEMNDPFSAGELVTVTLSHDLAGADGSPMRNQGYTFQFWTRARESNWVFEEIQTLSTNLPGESSRPYGGNGADLNNDGWLDITVVNEDTADLRTFLNGGTGDGVFEPFLQPPAPVNDQGSPSESADFNNDGKTDIVVANGLGDSVSILLGNGDGTFGPQQEITVGSTPRGVAVLDVDGDGDMDVVNTNYADDSLSLLVNDGTGVFGEPTVVTTGGDGPWGLAASDLNGDGVLDLAMAARLSQQIIFFMGDGDGNLTPTAPIELGKNIWHLVAGDLNNDGHNDIVTSNTNNQSATVLLLDGSFGVLSSTSYPTEMYCTTPDIGDLDGDGDLDFSVAAGNWRNFRNIGGGVFTLAGVIDSPQIASCSIFMDIDNDGDLDQTLIDEIADVVVIQQNDGVALFADVNRDGVVSTQDLTGVILDWGPCPVTGPCAADVNGNGQVDVEDLIAVIRAWS